METDDLKQGLIFAGKEEGFTRVCQYRALRGCEGHFLDRGPGLDKEEVAT